MAKIPDCPPFADELVWGETFERLEPAAEVVGIDEVREMGVELGVIIVVEALDGCILDGPVHPLGQPIIRYVICGAHNAVRAIADEVYADALAGLSSLQQQALLSGLSAIVANFGESVDAAEMPLDL